MPLGYYDFRLWINPRSCNRGVTTYFLDPKALKIALDKYKDKVKAVIVVHLYGLLADIDQILSICDGCGGIAWLNI
jgi:hypothetical protein